jgi:hypothetical protein
MGSKIRTGRAEQAIGAFGAIVALLALGIGLYAWKNADRYATSNAAILVYVLAPTVFGASYIAALWFLPKQRVSLGLIAASLCVGVYLSEAAAYLIEYRRRAEARADDVRKIEYLVERRKTDASVYPVLSPRRLAIERDGRWFRSAIRIGGSETMPLGGISNSRHLLCERDSGWIEYWADQHGFNNPSDSWRDVEIMLVGDSFVQGFCVKEADSIAGQLRSYMSGVLNVGLLGQGPIGDLAVLKEWGPVVRPRLVGWFFWEGNDFSDLVKEKSTPALLRYLEPGYRQGLNERQPEIDSALRSFVELNLAKAGTGGLRNLASADDARKFWTLYHLRSLLGVSINDMVDIDHERFRLILLEAKTAVAEWGGEFLFVALPEVVNGRFGETEVFRRSREIAEGLAIKVVDPSGALNAAGATSVLDPGATGHYNEAGYRIVADSVLREIRKIEPRWRR